MIIIPHFLEIEYHLHEFPIVPRKYSIINILVKKISLILITIIIVNYK